MDSKTIDYYRNNADVLVARYQSAEDGLSKFFDEAFYGCSKIMDVGCGSGRDLHALLNKGFDAYGVDACSEMLEQAKNFSADAHTIAGRVAQDVLPGLMTLADGTYDGVLCSAVLMHVPDNLLFDSVYNLRRILKPGGRLLVSIPENRPDIDAKTRRDTKGRLFSDLVPEKLSLLIERIGFRTLWSKTTGDSLGRSECKWTSMLFEKLEADTERPLDKVESILNRDRKDATYKLALFRALSEIALTQYNQAEFVGQRKVKIPIESVALKWLEYYWPLIDSEIFIAQKYGEKAHTGQPIAIRKPLKELANLFNGCGGFPAFFTAFKRNALSVKEKVLLKIAMSKIKHTIWNMPVRHAGGGDFDVLDYDKNDKTIILPCDLWRELALTGSWIKDATVLRWAELTAKLSNNEVSLSMVVEKLLSVAEQNRETLSVRKYYEQVAVSECVWSLRPIRERFDIDHVIPFSLWRNNDLWNLLPTLPDVNNKKRDQLPAQELIHDRRDIIISYWEMLRNKFENQFDREAYSLCGENGYNTQNWQATLFSRFSEAIEITACARSVPRWYPDDMGGSTYTKRASSNYKQQRQAVAELVSTQDVWGRSNDELKLVAYDNISTMAFVEYLPMVGSLAAGVFYSGFELRDLDHARECQWVKCPGSVCRKNRFVVRVGGDSMEPKFNLGELLVFEYHRTPRNNGDIVIANLAEFGATSDSAAVDAIKLLQIEKDHWKFRSLNPKYLDINVSKDSCDYPILGVFIHKL
jgi:SAM-dependent methyltransferase/SOS-response transcriptional repressor LexA